MELVSDAERRKVLIALPEPVDERLEMLISIARLTGIQASRSQLLAALITVAPITPEDLASIVRRYLSLELPTFAESRPRGDLPAVRHPGPRRRARRS
jgi:hypothetical protein